MLVDLSEENCLKRGSCWIHQLVTNEHWNAMKLGYIFTTISGYIYSLIRKKINPYKNFQHWKNSRKIVKDKICGQSKKNPPPPPPKLSIGSCKKQITKWASKTRHHFSYCFNIPRLRSSFKIDHDHTVPDHNCICSDSSRLWSPMITL